MGMTNCPWLEGDLPLVLHLMHLFQSAVGFFIVEFHIYIICDDGFAFSYSFWDMLFQVQSAIADVSLHKGLHTSVLAGENVPK